MSINNCRKMALLCVAFLLSATSVADAQTLGTAFVSTRDSIEKVPLVLTTISYIAGLFLAAAGIFKFKEHVDNPQQAPISAGVKRFLAGGMFLSGPFMYEALRGTLFGGGVPTVLNNTSRTAITIDLTDGISLDEMVINLMTDIGGPVELLLIIVSYIFGIALLLVGISRLTKRLEEGPKGPAGVGTMMTFLASGALFSFGGMMGTFSSSLFGDATVNTLATIDSSIGLSAADADKIQAVIEAVMAFIMIVGYIAFIRGWFVLKSFADGAQGATLAQGLVFLFGGALAINLGELVNMLQNSVGVSGITFG